MIVERRLEVTFETITVIKTKSVDKRLDNGITHKRNHSSNAFGSSAV